MDIEDDVLQAAKELAQLEGRTAGQIISTLARRGLTGSPSETRKSPKTKNGVPILPSRGELITLDQVKKLMDKEGI